MNKFSKPFVCIVVILFTFLLSMQPPNKGQAQFVASAIKVDTTLILHTDSVKFLLDSAYKNKEAITRNGSYLDRNTSIIERQVELIQKQNEILDSLERH